MKACFYLQGRCMECRVIIHAHGWTEPDALEAFGSALIAHAESAHYRGEPIEITDALVAEVTTV